MARGAYGKGRLWQGGLMARGAYGKGRFMARGAYGKCKGRLGHQK